MHKTIPLALSTLLAVALAGCDASIEPTPTPSGSGTSQTSIGVAALYGADAIFLSDFIQRFPGDAPQEMRKSTVFFEAAGSGSAIYDLPSPVGERPSLILTIFCDAPSKYEVAIVRADEVVDRTWGDKCPQSGIVLYTTAPIEGALTDLQASVTVDADVPYRVSILQTP